MSNLRLSKLRELGYFDYNQYLRSRHWRSVRRQYRRERPWVCACCPEIEGLELHHKTYERIGEELLDDLCPLCQECHAGIHLRGDLDPESIDRQRRKTEYTKSRTDNPQKQRRRQQRQKQQSKESLEPPYWEPFMREDEIAKYGTYLAKESAKRRAKEKADKSANLILSKL